jgi:adenosylcobinamide-phosphate guanylyltransferase
MDALVMCGGRGTRLGGDREKPLVAVAGEPMVDWVIDAAAASGVERVVAAVSPHAPQTRAHLRERDGVAVVETPGEGYVADLNGALADDRLARPVLTVAADLPVLDGAIVDRILTAHEGGSLTVAVPAALKRDLGVSVDTTFEHDGRELAPVGVNIGGGEAGDSDAAGDDGANGGGDTGTGKGTLVVDDERLAVNVNRPGDLVVAERLVGT